MNNWYNRINAIPQVQKAQTPQKMNPMQQMQFAMNAMRNPAAFIQEQFPDVPENIRNNPNAILNYLAQTRGNRMAQDIQQVSGMQGGKY